jgi:hypothetical protein
VKDKRIVCEWPREICYERPDHQDQQGAAFCALHYKAWTDVMLGFCAPAPVPFTPYHSQEDRPMARSRNNQMTIPELQAVASKFVKTHIENNSFGLAPLDEEQFKNAMDAIVKAMMLAWQDGYLTGRGK